MVYRAGARALSPQGRAAPKCFAAVRREQQDGALEAHGAAEVMLMQGGTPVQLGARVTVSSAVTSAPTVHIDHLAFIRHEV